MSKKELAKNIAFWGVIILVSVLILSVIIYGALGVGERRGQSQYTGHVVDVVEDKGLILQPTWTNMKTDPRSSDIQSYCITPDREDELLPKFYNAMEDGDRYTVTYHRPLWVNPNHCDSGDAIITDIQPVNESA